MVEERIDQSRASTGPGEMLSYETPEAAKKIGGRASSPMVAIAGSIFFLLLAVPLIGLGALTLAAGLEDSKSRAPLLLLSLMLFTLGGLLLLWAFGQLRSLTEQGRK